MPILVRNVRLGLDQLENDLLAAAAKKLRFPATAIRTCSIVRRSVDARRKDDVHFLYQLELELNESPSAQRARLQRLHSGDVSWMEPLTDESPELGTEPLRGRPTIIGFGPAGMFAALILAQYGYRPIVYERGREVRRRHLDVMHRFYRLHEFDPTSNLLFGEGGAGTYSDGKLYTRIHDPLCRLVLELLYQHGADPDILIDSRPHVGSDRLPTICTQIRRKIESLGGEVRFECHVDDLQLAEGGLQSLHVFASGSSLGEWVGCGPTILAIGHSARDTIHMLHHRGVHLASKPFQIGVRIEHPQEMIDRWQYGAAAGHSRLGPAEYHCVAKGAGAELGDMFSFCMCPGGEILPTNESAGLVATNGASRANRSNPFGNSGLVLTVHPARLACGGGLQPVNDAALALRGLEYLVLWERLAFTATGGSYQVPSQRASDFLAGRTSDGRLETSYPLGGQWTDVAKLVPEQVAAALRHALPRLDAKFPGFAGPDGLITAPETRASSPIRIVRDEHTRQAVDVADLYPAGEGAGYAGGIISAAVDGIRTAYAIIRRYAAR